LSEPAREPVGAGKRHPKLSLAWKIITISFGVSLVLLGILGLFLPVLQGWLMIFGGLAVLSPHSRKARWVLRTLKEKLRIPQRHGSRREDGSPIGAEEEKDRRTGS